MSDLTPQTAWLPFEPTAGDWDIAKVAHFYRRAGFGATVARLQSGVELTPAELTETLFSQAESPEESATFDRLAKSSVPTNNADSLSASWLYRMLKTPDVLREKMALFWHGHFATSNEKVQDTKLMLQQNQLIRQHATGDFKQLVHGIAKDPAMLIYLDSESNRKSHPNENFARELMELFVLGEGNYTEADVRELARCFTGWELRRGRFRFNRYQCDQGEKKVLGSRGKLTGEQGVDVVLNHEAGPKFIARKLVKFFVCDEPELDDAIIAPLAKQLRDADWDVAPVLKTIFNSRLFYSSMAIARKVRSPIELAVGLLRSLDATCNTVALSTAMRQVGQGLFHPPNVKGWDGGRTWVNSSTLLGRANLVRDLMSSDKTKFAGGSLEGVLSLRKGDDDQSAVDCIERLLVAVALKPAVREQLVLIVKTAEGSRDERLRKAIHAISIQPEFQLG